MVGLFLEKIFFLKKIIVLKKKKGMIYLKIPKPIFEFMISWVPDALEAQVWNQELIEQCIQVALGILPSF